MSALPTQVETSNCSSQQAAASSVPKKRKLEHVQESEASSVQDSVAPENCKPEFACDATSAQQVLRLQRGQRVICNLAMSCKTPVWKTGTVDTLFHKMEDGETVPYMVKLDNGKKVAPDDHDEMIRLAARACADKNVMLAFAVPQARWKARKLRFAEGDRVAVQLDERLWEEGVVIEVWARPPSTKLKAWSRAAVPYAVSLDIGDRVLVPYDSEEVIREESAALPAQKSIAEQIGGTVKTPLSSDVGSRFIQRFNAAGEWVQVDTRTGRERPCSR